MKLKLYESKTKKKTKTQKGKNIQISRNKILWRKQKQSPETLKTPNSKNPILRENKIWFELKQNEETMKLKCDDIPQTWLQRDREVKKEKGEIIWVNGEIWG